MRCDSTRHPMWKNSTAVLGLLDGCFWRGAASCNDSCFAYNAKHCISQRSTRFSYGPLAQLVEQLTLNQ